MKKSLKTRMPLWRSARFRTPLRAEKSLGLWVDRVGVSVARNEREDRLRVLGLYAAVGVERGEGGYFDRVAGELKVPQGAAIMVFPETPHQYWPQDRWQTRFVVWGGEEAELLARLGFPARGEVVVPGGAAVVGEANRRLQQIMNDEGRDAILARKALLLEMLLGLHRVRQMPEDHGFVAQAMARALSWMRTNYARAGVSVPACAAAAGLSVSHFRRLFSRHTGRSPKDFLVSLRISRAKELLSGNMPIKAVADAVGYGDQFHFMREFRRVVGQPAGRFRAGH